MRARRLPPWLLTTAIALFAAGCDPGYSIKPIAWLEEPGPKYAHTFDGFALRTRSMGGLVGEWWLYPVFEVVGNAEPLTLKSASLNTAKGRYAGVVDPRNAEVPPGGGRLSVRWEFGSGHPAAEILGEHAEIALEIEVGTRPQTVRIEFARVPCC